MGAGSRKQDWNVVVTQTLLDVVWIRNYTILHGLERWGRIEWRSNIWCVCVSVQRLETESN